MAATSGDAASQFEIEMLLGCSVLNRRYSYAPTRYLQGVQRHGAVEQAKRTLALPGRAGISEGLMRLSVLGALEYSTEFFALKPWYRHLFTDEEIEVAEYRLTLLEFPYEQELAALETPAWAEEAGRD